MRKMKTLLLMVIIGGFFCQMTVIAGEQNRPILERIGVKRGICVVLGDKKCELALKLAAESELLIYMQFPLERQVELARRVADAAGFYGSRIYVEKGALTKIHLADNLADAVVVVGEAAGLSEDEVLRVLRPRGKALLGRKELVKPFPEGVDDWSHPYHGPDNNPQSNDQVARAPYLTQFLAGPHYGPGPQVAVASGGRVFKAFGHVAFHKREEPYLNTLVAFNGYNGTIIWKRDLVPGIMIHRNTMVATPTILYVGDDSSCKIIDAATGRMLDEISPPVTAAGGTFWKWMGLEDGVLYALIGEQEQKDAVMQWCRGEHGWSWGEISRGFNQGENPWGFGRNVLAIDAKTKEVLWHYHEDEAIDSRGMCMKNGRIYIHRFGAFLACLDAKTGSVIWRKTPDSDPGLFEAIGPDMNRQFYKTNWRTTAYLKCSDKALYFAGPQVGKLLAVSAQDGSVLWEYPYDNFQLVLRDDGLYGISGPWGNNISRKFEPLTGRVLMEPGIGRRACTRPTGSVDSILFRADGGTVRFDVASGKPEWISPMRPQCHEGVTIANGLLYWWPWACDCRLTLTGVTCLGPAGAFDFMSVATEQERLEKGVRDLSNVVSLQESVDDWPTFRADNRCSATTEATISDENKLLWEFKPSVGFVPTAPVAAGGLIFVGGSDGVVRAFDASSGDVRWKAFTGGEVRFPPTIWKSRALVGSGDGWVYCFEAATGRLLWRYRAAPAERKIPVYGKLSSTWPAASGVLVEDGTAYVAAGIVNYDGTYVYALDAATGRIKWQNNSSGHLNRQARTGVSVQGHMLVNDGKLYLAGGTSISPAVYDIRNGKCLNDAGQLQEYSSESPRGLELYLFEDMVSVSGKPFYGHPKYEVFAGSVTEKMFITSTGDRDILWVNSRKVMCFDHVEENRAERFKAGWGELDIPGLEPLWEYNCDDSVAVAVCKNAVVVARKTEIVALNLRNGKVLWRQPVSSTPVVWGLAVDSDGRVIVVLENGNVVCVG